MRKFLINLLFFILVCFPSFIFSDVDVFDDTNFFLNSFIDVMDETTRAKPTSKEVLDTLIDNLGVDKVLRQDLFLKTYYLNTRRLLDNSMFIMNKDYDFGKYVLDFNLFYDQTTRMHFVRKCSDGRCEDRRVSGISNYIAICDPCLINALDELKEKAKELYPELDYDVEKILGLFRNTTVQERRAGMFMGFRAQVKKLHIALQTPFYYVIRNIFLTDQERKAIEKELGSVNPGETNEAEAMAFARQHVVCDRLGLGDTRFSVDYPVNDNGGIDFRLGLFVDIPTSVSMIKGLYGATFCPITKRPNVNFLNLFELIEEGFIDGDEQAKEQLLAFARNFGTCVLDGISSMLIDTQLGSRRHFGLGIHMRTHTPLSCIWNRNWTQKLFFKGKISLEYLFPGKECRWFIEKCNPSEFNRFDKYRYGASVDDQVADEDLAFLEKKFVDMLFPYVYETTVRPGLIFIWAENLTYEGKRWGIHIGSDIWVQTRESLSDICCPTNQLTLLNVEKARRPWAHQWSILGSIFFKSKRKKSGLYIGLNGEKIVSSSGIGKPFKVSLSFERNF